MRGRAVAVLVSDVHLTLKAPAARAEKQDWLAVQAGYLKQLRKLAQDHRAVVVYAGDIFDRWNSPPELINFAIRELPRGYAVPGQHDLPFHNYQDIRKSSYWTLVEAGVIEHLEYGVVYEAAGHGHDLKVNLVGFPWGAAPRGNNENCDDDLSIAVVHRYCWWRAEHSYPGALKENQSARFFAEYPGFDVIHTGDNHKGFVTHGPATTIVNCGGFVNRKSDERGYKPFVGLVHADGTVTKHFLDVSKDRWADDLPAKNQAGGADIEGLIDLITQAGDGALDFAEQVRNYLDANNVGKRVRKFVLESLEGS